MRTEIIGGTALLRARTLRALKHLELEPDDTGPTWFLRAGAFSLRRPELAPSATGKPVLGFGAIRGDPEWAALLADSAGILDSIRDVDVNSVHMRAARPRVASVLIDNPSPLRRQLLQGASFDEAAWAVAREGTHRCVRIHDLDVGWDERLRPCIAVTTLHRGGAERIALELHRALARDIDSLFVVMDDVKADGYEAPGSTLHICRGDRLGTLASRLHEHGADVLHAHLFGREQLRALAGCGVPLATTIHNDRSRWPDGFDSVHHESVALVLACSRRVHAELKTHVRRIASNFATRAAAGDRVAARRALEIPETAPLILCVANPRLQKRLDLAVETLAFLRSHGEDGVGDARLVIAGRAMPGKDGEAAMRALESAIALHRLEPFVRLIGAQRAPSQLYAAADVVLTTSAYEGMSVVQLEALAAGVPVVTTDVGGSDELAATHVGYHVAAPSPEALSTALATALSGPRPVISARFEGDAAAARHVRAYRGAALRPTTRGGLVLVINNLATGGAQASARRLLLELHARRRDVAVVVLQEQARFASAWRAELERSMPVFVAPRAGSCDAAVSAAAVSDFVRTRDATTVVFWNVMPLYKLLIADELVGCRLHDVSPGEMYFAELARYFEEPRADLPYLDARDYGALLDGVIVKFAAEAERAQKLLGAHVTVIPNGVPVATTLGPRRPRGDRFVIGTLARLAPDKKLEELLEAMRHVPGDCTLRIAGRVAPRDEAYAAGLFARAASLPVTFVGDVDSSSFLRDLDAFAMVSEPAGCPNALLEAMAAGLPTAATNVGGASEAIDDGATGLLVPRGDWRALGDALSRLARDAQLGDALGRAAHARIAERFSLGLMADAYETALLD